MYGLVNRPSLQSRFPRTFVVLASNDGSSWNVIDNQRLTSNPDLGTQNEVRYSTSTNQTPYFYYRLVIMANFYDCCVHLINWNLYTYNSVSIVNQNLVVSGNNNTMGNNNVLGSVNAVGNITSKGVISSGKEGFGSAQLNVGGTTVPGYISFFDKNNIRAGYVGWGDGPNLLLQTEGAGYSGYKVTGNLTVSGNQTVNSPAFFGSTAAVSDLSTAGSVNIKNTNAINPLYTHFNYTDGNNYIRGNKTIFSNPICIGNTCLAESDFQKVLQLSSGFHLHTFNNFTDTGTNVTLYTNNSTLQSGYSPGSNNMNDIYFKLS